MKIRVDTIRPSRKESALAEAVIEISDGSDNITVDDLRILRNKQGALWIAMPSHALPITGGRGYEYRPTVTLSRNLQGQIEDAVLAAFEQWNRDSVKTQGGER